MSWKLDPLVGTSMPRSATTPELVLK